MDKHLIVSCRQALSCVRGIGNATTRYFLPDHLNSTNVVTIGFGTALQILDYYPYGLTRIR